MTSYAPKFMSIVSAIDTLMQQFVHTKKDIGYGYRRTFANGHRVDLINYKKKNISILRVGRGAWFVRTYPILHGFFDEVLGVIAKLYIHDIALLHKKHVI